MIYSASYKTIKIWSADSFTCLKTLKEHGDRICCIIRDQNSKIIFSGSFDNNIKIWNIDTGKCLKTLTGHKKCVYNILFDDLNQTLFSCSLDNSIK